MVYVWRLSFSISLTKESLATKVDSFTLAFNSREILPKVSNEDSNSFLKAKASVTILIASAPFTSSLPPTLKLRRKAKLPFISPTFNPLLLAISAALRTASFKPLSVLNKSTKCLPTVSINPSWETTKVLSNSVFNVFKFSKVTLDCFKRVDLSLKLSKPGTTVLV